MTSSTPDQLKLSPDTPNQTAQSVKRGNRKDRTKHIFLMPAVIWILVFTVFPLLYAIYTSFFSFRYGKINQFVGLDNFGRLFTDANLHGALWITLTFVVVTVTIEMVLGFSLALVFNHDIYGKNVWRALMVLPLFATPVAMGYLGITLFYETNGPVNAFISALGGNPPPWLSNPFWAPIAVMLIEIWQWTPFVFLVALAALQGLPEDIYEAAKVDGGSPFQLFYHITLPLMTPILFLILLLRVVEAFKVFDIATSLTSGGPGRATEVYSLFTYRTGLRFFDHGYAAAQGFLLLIIVSIVISLLFSRIRELYEVQR